MIDNNLFQVAAETPWEDLGNGIKRQIFGYNDQIMMVKAKFEKEAIGEPHEHYHAQVAYIESGVFEVTVSGEKKILKQGDGFFAPPNERHGCVCLEAGVIVDVFSPHREDFLKTDSSK